ncbi:MAG: hypothetical protein AAFV53_33645 [Myxococcota bacterium]
MRWLWVLLIGCNGDNEDVETGAEARCSDECACNVPIREYAAWNTELQDGFVGGFFTGLSTGVYEIYGCPDQVVDESCGDTVLCHDAVDRITSFGGGGSFLRLEQRYIDEGECSTAYVLQVDVSCAELRADPAGYEVVGLGQAEGWMVEQVDAQNRACGSSIFQRTFTREGDRVKTTDCGGDTLMYRITGIYDRQI